MAASCSSLDGRFLPGNSEFLAEVGERCSFLALTRFRCSFVVDGSLELLPKLFVLFHQFVVSLLQTTAFLHQLMHLLDDFLWAIEV